MQNSAKLPETFVPAALVVECVASFFAVSVLDLRSPRRSTSLNRARQVAAVLMAEHSMVSMVEIGHALGRRDHSTGRHLYLEALKLKGDDQRFAKLVEQVSERLTKGDDHGE